MISHSKVFFDVVECFYCVHMMLVRNDYGNIVRIRKLLFVLGILPWFFNVCCLIWKMQKREIPTKQETIDIFPHEDMDV